jgi:uncharacterized membrane protein YkvA (DUF1232 family)
VDTGTWFLVIAALILGSVLALAAIAAFLWWRVQTSEEKRLAKRIAKLGFRDKLSLARALFTDRRVSFLPGLIALTLIVYLAIPIDIVPDFIPVIGYADDLLIVVIGAGLLLRSIPTHVLDEHVGRYEQAASERSEARSDPPKGLQSGG